MIIWTTGQGWALRDVGSTSTSGARDFGTRLRICALRIEIDATAIPTKKRSRRGAGRKGSTEEHVVSASAFWTTHLVQWAVRGKDGCRITSTIVATLGNSRGASSIGTFNKAREASYLRWTLRNVLYAHTRSAADGSCIVAEILIWTTFPVLLTTAIGSAEYEASTATNRCWTVIKIFLTATGGTTVRTSRTRERITGVTTR